MQCLKWSCVDLYSNKKPARRIRNLRNSIVLNAFGHVPTSQLIKIMLETTVSRIFQLIRATVTASFSSVWMGSCAAII